VTQFKPQLIYLPSFLDQHADHRATNEVLKNIELNKVLISAYEVWTPLIPNRLVDITAVVKDKVRAIEAHESQLANLDYKTAILSLNQYRGLMYSKKQIQYAEAFICMPSADYFKLMASVST
jgi:LmbE family N-acetylglucosaminyl deacetylase